jgi:hypothetical protein
MAERLGGISRDLDAAGEVAADDPAALGGRVAGSLDRFSASSGARRRELAKLVGRLSTLVAGAADAYRATDDTQAAALANSRARP